MKRIKRILVALCCVCLLAACGNDESAAQDVQRTVDDAAQKAEDAANDAADAGEKTVDDMMAHLREMQKDIQQEEVIEDIPFAAYDGRSFQVEGNTMYLYRINAQDGDMKRVTEQLQQDNMVNVERNGQKMQYSGALYEDYLLLYEPGVNADSLIEGMNSFAAGE